MAEGVKLGVEGGIAAFVGAVAAARDDLVVVDEDAADGDLGSREGFFGLQKQGISRAKGRGIGKGSGP